MTEPRKDGCPRCLRRDNEPITWDETTGKATYRCICGHAWSTWWEHPEPETGPVSLGDLTAAIFPALSTRNPKEQDR